MEKPKNTQITRQTFILIWLIGAIASALVAITLPSIVNDLLIVNQLGLNVEQFARLSSSVNAVLIAIPMLIAHQLIFERGLGHPICHWIPASLLATALAYLLSAEIFYTLVDQIEDYNTLFFILSLVPHTAVAIIALAQMVLLRNHVRNAWLWVIALIVGNITALPFMDFIRTAQLTHEFAIFADIMASALITGIIMWHLLTRHRLEKHKMNELND